MMSGGVGGGVRIPALILRPTMEEVRELPDPPDDADLASRERP